MGWENESVRRCIFDAGFLLHNGKNHKKMCRGSVRHFHSLSGINAVFCSVQLPDIWLLLRTDDSRNGTDPLADKGTGTDLLSSISCAGDPEDLEKREQGNCISALYDFVWCVPFHYGML